MQTRSILSEDDLLLEADYLATGQPGDLIFKSGGVERGRILSSGAGTGLLAPGNNEFHVATYLAVGSAPGVTPTVDETTQIQNCINAAAAVGGTVVFGLRNYKVTTLNLTTGVTLQGAGKKWVQGIGTWLYGTAGSNVIVLPDYPNASGGIWMRDFSITGGENCIATSPASTQSFFIYMDNMALLSPVVSCLSAEGYIDNWHLRNMYIYGGQYGFRKLNSGATQRNMDKCSFENVLTGNQSKNAWRLECGVANGSCGSNNWTNLVMQTSGEHGFYADCGLYSSSFVNVNTEGCGQTGKMNQTTLTNNPLAVGATSCVLASNTGWASGDTITIKGAGVSGKDLTVGGAGSTLVGSTFDWSAAAIPTATSTQVATGTAVTNAVWDDFFFQNVVGSASGNLQFFGGSIGGIGTGGKLRYALNGMGFNNTVSLFGTITLQAPVYDHAAVISVYGPAALRRESVAGASIPGLGQPNTASVRRSVGAPVDADFTAPIDGIMAVDVTNSKLWVRVGGVWKGVVIA